ncbi:MAG: hypothetical protein ACFFDX_13915, partial [Candidatus Odinarchaeota archaeon]
GNAFLSSIYFSAASVDLLRGNHAVTTIYGIILTSLLIRFLLKLVFEPRINPFALHLNIYKFFNCFLRILRTMNMRK